MVRAAGLNYSRRTPTRVHPGRSAERYEKDRARWRPLNRQHDSGHFGRYPVRRHPKSGHRIGIIPAYDREECGNEIAILEFNHGSKAAEQFAAQPQRAATADGGEGNVNAEARTKLEHWSPLLACSRGLCVIFVGLLVGLIWINLFSSGKTVG